MGASGWSYVVEYEDLAEALEKLLWQAFRNDDYFWPDDDEWAETWADPPRPAHPDGLFDHPEFPYRGAHSILDVTELIDPDDEHDYGELRPLTGAEQLTVFGTTRLTRETFHPPDNFGESQRGYAVPLYENDRPAWWAIWGFSGD